MIKKGQAEKELDRHINEFSEERAKANAAALAEETDRKSRLEERREENRELWIEHYELLYRSRARAAKEYAHKALQLKGEEQ